MSVFHARTRIAAGFSAVFVMVLVCADGAHGQTREPDGFRSAALTQARVDRLQKARQMAPTSRR